MECSNLQLSMRLLGINTSYHCLWLKHGVFLSREKEVDKRLSDVNVGRKSYSRAVEQKFAVDLSAERRFRSGTW